MATRRHHSDKGDDRPETPTDPDWDELSKRITVEGALHRHDPAVFSRIKIGRFDAQVEIGRGGFGIVFKALDPKLNRWVALKLCLTRTPDAIDSLLEEARVLAKLDHPNIVAVLEPGEYEGSVFFAMPYIDGQNAAQFSVRAPRPSCQEVLDVFIDVASGLAAAHDAHIVHGDVKPRNVLIGSDNRTRIADFGLGRRVIEDADESEQEGLRHRAGTLYYMAPERLRGEPADAKSDQFSFFVALKQTLDRGVLPFVGDSSAEMLEDIEATEVQFEDPSLPKEILALIRIGLSVDPSERFPDMKTVRAELIRIRNSPLDESVLDEPPLPDDGPDEPPTSRETTPNKPPSDTPLPARLAPDEPPPQPTPDELPQLIPVGSAPGRARKPRRGAFAVALVFVGALGWVGRGRVESPGASESEPVLLSQSPCASVRPNEKLDASVIAACERIREGDFDRATDGWAVEHRGRRTWNEARASAGEITEQEFAAEVVELGADTMIVARTFLDRALASGGDGEAAARQAHDWALKAAAVLRADHPRVISFKAAFARCMLMLGASDVQAQAVRLVNSTQGPAYSSQHQIEPSSSTYP